MQILEQVQDLPKAGNIKAQWVSLWTGPAVGAVLLVAALAFPGFWPPMSPTWSAQQVAGFYADHTAWILKVKWLAQHRLCGLVDEGGKALGGGVVVQGGPGSGVELVLDGFEVGLGVAAEVGAFFEPEPQQPVGVLVAAPLPG